MKGARFTIAVGEYVLQCVPDGLPETFEACAERAKLVERIDLSESNRCCVMVGRANEPWPFLVVAQSFEPAGSGFAPGLLLAEDAARLFLGAGERLLAYDLAKVERLWSDDARMGFWRWARHRDVVVMSAELELAAWTAAGAKLWTTFVEPPWDYSIFDDEVVLDVMGVKRRFSLRSGPPRKG